jgi:hypothetical protein
VKDQHPKVDPTLLFPLPFLSSPFHSFPHTLGIIVINRQAIFVFIIFLGLKIRVVWPFKTSLVALNEIIIGM